MEAEHNLIASIGNQLLETKVSQRYNIGDGIFTEHQTVVVDVQHCLVGNCCCAAIDIKSHISL